MRNNGVRKLCDRATISRIFKKYSRIVWKKIILLYRSSNAILFLCQSDGIRVNLIQNVNKKEGKILPEF